MAVAKFLTGHKSVEWVNYPGLPNSQYHDLAKKYLPKGAGAVFCFGVKGGYQAGRKLVDNAKLLSHLANVGDAKSLVIHPASTTHQQLSAPEQKAAGVEPDMIRLSIGLEDLDDIIWDLEFKLPAASCEVARLLQYVRPRDSQHIFCALKAAFQIKVRHTSISVQHKKEVHCAH